MSVELCTDQGDRIRTAFESFKDFSFESVIIFRPNEVELVAQEHSQVVDIRLILSADKIRETGGYYRYESTEPQMELGIRTKIVADVLKRYTPGGRVLIGARRGKEREFYVTCRNPDKTFTSKIVAPMVGSTERPDLRGVFKYSGSIYMNSSVFHGIIGDLLTANPPVITFDCDGESLKLSGEGMFSKSVVRIGGNAVKEESEEETVNAGALFEKGTAAFSVLRSYATLHLHRIAKANKMSSRICISLSPDFPASFEYDTPIGKLTYFVAARNVDDIDDPKLKAPDSGLEGDPNSKKRRFTVNEPVAEFEGEEIPMCEDV